MTTLDKFDLSFSVRRLPKVLTEIVKDVEWQNKIYIGGGFIRAIVAGEEINDVDVFVNSLDEGKKLAQRIAGQDFKIYETDNAFTVKTEMPIQIIHRWTFDKPEDVINSFDFSICCAVIFYTNGQWQSLCDDRFYVDLSAKRLVYRRPTRQEEAGGSMLRILKYYQRGYRIPLDSLGSVIARLIKAIDQNITPISDEEKTSFVITGLLREVDPSIDPLHEAHIPTEVKI